jgi:hypothetical protein
VADDEGGCFDDLLMTAGKPCTSADHQDRGIRSQRDVVLQLIDVDYKTQGSARPTPVAASPMLRPATMSLTSLWFGRIGLDRRPETGRPLHDGLGYLVNDATRPECQLSRLGRIAPGLA